jgi:hypothetical protein
MIIVGIMVLDARMVFCATVRNEHHFKQLIGIVGNNEILVGKAF